jgi:four helix bundle protein
MEKEFLHMASRFKPNIIDPKLDNMEKKYDLEERLISFASDIIDISESLPKTTAGAHLGNQLLRSGTSPALHYGEAQGAESRADFIHKMKICLKELRETYNCLRLLNKKKWIKTNAMPVIQESSALIAIFRKSVDTARNNASNCR